MMMEEKDKERRENADAAALKEDNGDADGQRSTQSKCKLD